MKRYISAQSIFSLFNATDFEKIQLMTTAIRFRVFPNVWFKLMVTEDLGSVENGNITGI